MCFDAIIFSAGCSTSSTAAVTSAATLSAISNVLAANSTTVGQAFTANQVFTVNLTGATIAGTVNITQSLAADVMFVSSANTSISSSLINALQTTMQDNINNMSASQSALLSKALNGSTASQVSTTISSVLTSNSTVTQLTSIMNTFDIGQTLTIPAAGLTVSAGGVLNIGQTSILQLQAQAIASAVENVLLNNTSTAAISAAVAQSSTTTSTGIAAVFSAIGSIFTGPLKWIAIIVIICIVGLALLLVVRHSTHHKNPAAPIVYMMPPGAQAPV